MDMKHLKRTALFLLLMAAMATTANAQYVTTHAKSAMLGQQKGIYYALPRTVVQLDFVVEQTELLEGPYSDFAYLVGAEEYIVEDRTEYRLAEVRMHTYAEADPNATFFVATNPKKGESIQFYLTPKGILEGVGIQGTCAEPQAVPATAIPETKPQERAFKYQYGPTSMKSQEQMAHSAASMITTIREEKIKLLTGFQETAFTLDTYRQMYADLDAMEQEYLSLFVGKRISTTSVKTVYVTPSKEVSTQTIGKFSKEEGFSVGVNGLGSVITVQALSLQTTGNINSLSPSAVESINHENKLFYRIPETANIKVSLDGEVLLEQRETLAQFGVFMLAPLGNTKLTLDPETGQITHIEL